MGNYESRMARKQGTFMMNGLQIFVCNPLFENGLCSMCRTMSFPVGGQFFFVWFPHIGLYFGLTSGYTLTGHFLVHHPCLEMSTLDSWVNHQRIMGDSILPTWRDTGPFTISLSLTSDDSWMLNHFSNIRLYIQLPPKNHGSKDATSNLIRSATLALVEKTYKSYQICYEIISN